MSPTSAPPTRVRYSILAMLCLLAMITYMDRATIGSAKLDIMGAIQVDAGRFFYITAAFQLAYALFEIPTGWLGDRFGPRSTLLRVVLWWSVFVALTGFAGVRLPGSETILIGFWALLAIQFLFGIGEAGAFPNMSKALYNWFPADQRGTAQGMVWMSARFMGGMTPVVWVLLNHPGLGGMAWRHILWLFAGVAIVWSAAFYVWFRNTPAEHPATNQAEVDLAAAGKVVGGGHAGVPWGELARSRNVWLLCLMYTVTNFNWYFLMYDLPSLLKEKFPEWRGSAGGDVMLGVLGGSPLLIGMLGCFLGGRLTDRYVRRTGDRKWGRRSYGMLGYGLAGLFYVGAAAVTVAAPANLWLLAGMCMLVGFANDLMMAPSWATAQDIGGRYSAIVSGAMNMVGNLGATLGRLVSLAVVQYFEPAEGDPATSDGLVARFLMYAGVYACGVGVWLLIDPTKPVAAEPEAGHAASN